MNETLKILRWEVMGFLAVLTAILVYRVLTRAISLGGLFLRKDGSGQVSPERVQLLLATLAVSIRYIGTMVHGTGGTMPRLDPAWIWVFGGSSGVYMSVKAITTFTRKPQTREIEG